MRAISERDVCFVLATGRMPGGVRHIVDELAVPCHQILYSGAYVVCADGSVVLSRRLSKDDTLASMRCAAELYPKLCPSYFVEDAWYTFDECAENIRREGEIVKSEPKREDLYELVERGCLPNKVFFGCSGNEGAGKRLGRALGSIGLLDARVIVSSTGSLVEIVPRDVTKAHGAKVLLKRLGIDPCDVMAFGDDVNDVELLEGVGLGVAMANASPEVRDHACDVALSNNEQGVARYLEQAMEAGLFG